MGTRYSGTDGNDKIDAVASSETGQVHIYAGAGDDQIDLRFGSDSDLFNKGHHVRGDRNGDANLGADTFNFVDTHEVTNGEIIVGRIEDFDASRDTIRLEGEVLDLNALPDNARIVEYKGGHNDPSAASQQWLLISTSAGGHILYALEGARVDMTGNGGANSGKHESHFPNEVDLPKISDLKEVPYVDTQNYVPAGFAAQGGLTINDYDDDIDDVLMVIQGGEHGDLIAAGLNDDIVHSGAGADHVWGGSGNDLLSGEAGNDTMEGGTGNDTLRGQDGNDVLNGDQGNDNINGGTGDDVLYGGDGSDILVGGLGSDSFFGGAGIDRVDYRDSPTGVTVNLYQNNAVGGTAQGDRFDSVENVFGSSNADDLIGDGANNLLYGAEGDDLLRGWTGNDNLVGGTGNDTLIGHTGNDLLLGGAGADVFIFQGNFGHDRVIDFDPDEAGERIDLRSVESITSYSDLMTNHVTDLGSSIRIDALGGNTIILENIADVSQLSEDDFIF